VTRLSIILLAVLTLSALGLVTAQHKARKLFIELEREQEHSRQLDVEYGQLQLESSTWSMHTRIERIARQSLRMRLPEAGRVQIIDLNAPATAAPAAQLPDALSPGAAAASIDTSTKAAR
jgi:cell division protein FtsL